MANERVIVPVDEYRQFVETNARFNMLAEYLTGVFDREIDEFPTFDEGFLKAVIGYKKKGEVNAEKDHP